MIQINVPLLGKVISTGTFAFRTGFVKSISYHGGLNVYINYLDGSQDQVEFKSSPEARKEYERAVNTWQVIHS